MKAKATFGQAPLERALISQYVNATQDLYNPYFRAKDDASKLRFKTDIAPRLLARFEQHLKAAGGEHFVVFFILDPGSFLSGYPKRHDTIVPVACVSSKPHFPYQCQEPNGYTTNYEASAFNSLLPNSNQPPLSFFEAGNTTTDFVGQRTFSSYVILTEGQEPIIGSIWDFPLGDLLGSFLIGQFPVQIYNAAAYSFNTNQTYLYDPKTCSLVSSTIRNSDKANPGFTLMNFYNFENTFTESWFDLPSACSSQSVVSIPHTVTPQINNILKGFF
ncbi:hypothetical protein PPL_09086 [Heterostelium album PN500]|uniref:Uncharacterized protein n=1 Tax=Heterostelium pallidum (strain ATCC 26659 / Pp 5 / PN500) TaxID=670386 RepID=D3BKK4_HETP5|nr:hypothetical protein PPL_09086 [Heterostelium album PN500]EFA78434.1 hypothetical protein PPL_09086 [Heterostelium album PN500]|eukprot:XP_020430559.1 hypothetical protein PPL_09086 [Heterostelium album PN500]